MRHKLSRLLLALIIPQAAGLLGSLFTSQGVNTWYKTINKPSFNPPDWIFAPVWTLLFILMGVSFYLVWQTTFARKKCAYRIFFIQLIFNILWSVIFFGFQNPQLAFMEILVLWIMIFINICFFYQINKLASYLMIPYLAWVTFAAVLNFSIWQLNL